MIETARFIDNDGDMYSVALEPEAQSIVVACADGTNVCFYAIDGLKIIEGIQKALVQAALGGHYQVGPDREQLSDDESEQL
jgi:hypothetical protein